MTDYPALLYTSRSEILPFHLPEAWEEPPHIGHHREYPPPPRAWLPRLHTINPPLKEGFETTNFTAAKETYQILNALLPCCLHQTIN